MRISYWSSDVCSSDLSVTGEIQVERRFDLSAAVHRLRVDGAGRIVEERTAAETHAGKADRGDTETADDCANEVLHDPLTGSCARRPAKDTRGHLQGYIGPKEPGNARNEAGGRTPAPTPPFIFLRLTS